MQAAAFPWLDHLPELGLGSKATCTSLAGGRGRHRGGGNAGSASSLPEERETLTCCGPRGSDWAKRKTLALLTPLFHGSAGTERCCTWTSEAAYRLRSSRLKESTPPRTMISTARYGMTTSCRTFSTKWNTKRVFPTNLVRGRVLAGPRGSGNSSNAIWNSEELGFRGWRSKTRQYLAREKMTLAYAAKWCDRPPSERNGTTSTSYGNRSETEARPHCEEGLLLLDGRPLRIGGLGQAAPGGPPTSTAGRDRA